MIELVEVITFSIPPVIIIVAFLFLWSKMGDGAGGIGGYQ